MQRIQDFVTVSGQEVTLLKPLKDSKTPIQDGVLTLTDGVGRPVVTVNPETMTYSLHNGAFLKAEWKLEDGEIPGFPGASHTYVLSVNSVDHDILEVVDKSVVTARRRSTGCIWTTRPPVKYRRFTKGDVSIEVRSDGEVHVKGLSHVFPWDPKATKNPCDVTKVTQSNNSFCHNGKTIFYMTPERRLSRYTYGEDNFRFIKVD